jgi:2-aminobenzoate-CoA ligase
MTLVDTFAAEGLPPREQWPELRIEPLGYPERLNFAVALLDDAVAAGHADRPAIIGDDETISYRELQSRVDRVCRVLVDDLGMVSGNRVLLRAPNNAMLVITYLAVAKAGGIVVATMPLLRRKELTEIVDRAQISLALCDDRLLDEVDGLCDRLVPFAELQERAATKQDGFEAYDTASDDVCLIAFTSGTTGAPKGCMHCHRDVLAMCDLFPRHVLKPSSDDVFCGTPPLAFTFGLGGLLCFPLRVGASTVLIEKLTPETLLQTVERFHATIMFTAPTFYRQMAPLIARHDVSSLKKTVSAGEALPDSTRRLWRDATGIDMIDGIGGTELIHIFISAQGDEIRPNAIGRAVPGYVVRAVDDAMQPVPPGTIGKLAVRGPTGCRYLADDRQAKFVRDGWNLPGDSVYLDADGYVFYQARADDMIVSAGYNISGPEVESVLLQHDAVSECGVIGVADDTRGQIVKAFVVLNQGYAPDDKLVAQLQDFVKNSVAPYKYPRVITFVDALPRTETGKLKRFELRTMT